MKKFQLFFATILSLNFITANATPDRIDPTLFCPKEDVIKVQQNILSRNYVIYGYNFENRLFQTIVHYNIPANDAPSYSYRNVRYTGGYYDQGIKKLVCSYTGDYYIANEFQGRSSFVIKNVQDF